MSRGGAEEPADSGRADGPIGYGRAAGSPRDDEAGAAANARPLLLGVDAGGTKTRVVLAEIAGGAPRVVSETVGTRGELPGIGPDGMVERLAQWVREVLHRAGYDRDAGIEQIGAATLGLPGWDVSESWNAAWAGVARRALPHTRLLLLNDVVLAREGAFASGPGILALAGTGSMACGRNADGRIATVGGWGFAFGDEGSGYDLAREGLRAASRAADGRGPATTLAERIPAALGVDTLERVVERLVEDLDRMRARTAEVAPVVLRAAADGDAVAIGLVAAAARSVAEQVDTARRRLGGSELPLTVAGGLFASDAYRDAFAAATAAFGLPAWSAPTETATDAAIRLAHEACALDGLDAESEVGRHRGFRVIGAG